MIGWAAGLVVSQLAKRGVPIAIEAARRYVLIALVVLGVLVLAIGGCVAKRAYDRGVVEDARLKDNLEAVEGKAEADSGAAVSRQNDAMRSLEEQREIEEAIADATDPADARRAYYRCVRLQQQARAAGRPAPTCT